MRIWTYVRPFQFEGKNYQIKYHFSFTTYTSQLFCEDELLDECTLRFDAGLISIEHKLPTTESHSDVTVTVGYFSMWNVGIELKRADELIYASHPGKDIQYAVKKMEKYQTTLNSEEAMKKQQLQSEKWQQNKYSVFADIGLGIAFYIVAKVTGDLTTAALVGAALGLGLVVLQKFVKVDLLGGLAVFGTIMLVISAAFSLAFQSEQIVQLKGTILGLLSAFILLIDGLFRKGNYFGSRFERYLNTPFEHQYFVVGLALIAIVMAGLNYGVATYLTEDTWLTYKTFVDTPLNLIMFFTLVWLAGKKHQSVNGESSNVAQP